jgi:hypothetical protein
MYNLAVSRFFASVIKSTRLRSSKLLRSYLRGKRSWVVLRSAQREGFSRALKRWLLWRKILCTAPVITSQIHAGAPVEVHILTCQRDHLAALWALKSFYYFAQVHYPLVIHLQGEVTNLALKRLQEHFPIARIVLQDEADAVVERWLEDRSLFRLRDMRKDNVMLMKLVDFVIMCEAVNLLTLDSDILFFRKPSELLISNGEPLPITFFQHDYASSYNLTEEQALTELGIKLMPRLNAGLRLFARESVDLSRCEQYLAHPVVALQTGLIDQTLHALYASERGIAAYLPDSYLISLEPNNDLSLCVARHYAGASRPLLTDEGMRNLIQMGFLKW